MAQRYGLDDLDEARQFLAHPELGVTYERLVQLLDHAEQQGLARCETTIAALA